MEELAVKIAELLDISVQGAVDLYPVIRSQYIWYGLWKSISSWIGLLGVISLVVAVASFVVRQNTDKYTWKDKENDKYKTIDNMFRCSLIALILLIIIGVSMDVAIPFLAPDIVLIKDFLG